MTRRDWLAEEFERHRGHLRGVAYRMLGSVSEADDAVQEAWLRLDRSDPGGTDDLRGWLTVVVGRQSARLEHLVETDVLTGLPNRRAWDRLLSAMHADARRSGLQLAILVLDLDGFKRVNDERGHAEGDRVLASAAAAWLRELPDGGLIVRWGGEEFVAALRVGNRTEAATAAERLRTAVPPEVTCSAGLALVGHGDEDIAARERVQRRAVLGVVGQRVQRPPGRCRGVVVRGSFHGRSPGSGGQAVLLAYPVRTGAFLWLTRGSAGRRGTSQDLAPRDLLSGNQRNVLGRQPQAVAADPAGEGLTAGAGIAIAVFGLLVTLSLFVYDQRNSQLHDELISRGRRIEKELGVTVEAVYDTAGGAKLVAEQRLTGAAALASRRAAEVFGLEVIQEAVQDFEFNITRFFVIGGAPRTDANKTTIVFALPSTPGSLFKALSVFALRDINLSKLESRPIRGRPWEYLFYVDIESRRDDLKLGRALTQLGEFAKWIRVLGTYKGWERKSGT